MLAVSLTFLTIACQQATAVDESNIAQASLEATPAEDATTTTPMTPVEPTVFTASASTTINEICNKNCQYIRFADNSILNADGSALDVSTLSSASLHYDFATVKTQCLSCQETSEGVSTPTVDAKSFVDCVGGAPDTGLEKFEDCE